AAAREAVAFLAVEPPADPIARSRRASAVAALVKAWEAACERIRIARGQPLPGSRRPGPRQPARRVRRGLAPTNHHQGSGRGPAPGVLPLRCAYFDRFSPLCNCAATGLQTCRGKRRLSLNSFSIYGLVSGN